MKVRLLLILSALAAAVGILFVVVDSDPPPRTGEVGVRTDPGEREAIDEPDKPREAEGRTAIGSGRKTAAPAPGFPEVTADATGDERVLVRIRLAFADERTPSTSGRFRGQAVEMQSWSEETDETFLHRAVIDERDVAELEFPGAVHLDWIRFEPPRSSELALVFSEHHLDLEPGSLFELTLRLGPGAEVTGRVLFENGWPADGVTVQAYYRGGRQVAHDGELVEQYPGHARARTLVDGGFAFPDLQPGSWEITVSGPEWLQLDPARARGRGRTWAGLEPGEHVDVGELRITRRHSFALRVTDAAGNPAADMWVRLEPLGFRSIRLPRRRFGKQKPDSLELWLRGEAPPEETDAAEDDSAGTPIEWPYGILAFRTDAQGEVECHAVAGEWELSVRPEHDSSKPIARIRIVVPCGDQTLALRTVLADLEGVVVDETDRPVQFALVTATRGEDELSTMSDAKGIFRLPGLSRGSYCALRIEHLRFLPGEWTIQPGSPRTPRRFPLPPAKSLTIRAVDPAGEPLPGLEFRLISERPTGGKDALAAANRPRTRISGDTDHRGTLRIHQLLPGEYELGLYLPTRARGNSIFDQLPGDDPWDRGREGSPPWQKWTVSTEREEHVLTVDLAGYEPPADPVYAEHRGVVRDARTGRPVAGAKVVVRRSGGAISTRTGKDGEFLVSVKPAAVSIQVYHEGYLPLSIDSVYYPEGPHRHELLLDPDSNEVRITFRGKNGGSLPDLHARLSATALIRPPNRKPYWRETATAHDGVLLLEGLTLAPLELTLALDSLELGVYVVEVSPEPGVQEIEVSLEQTVEELRTAIRHARGLGGRK